MMNLNPELTNTSTLRCDHWERETKNQERASMLECIESITIITTRN